MTTPELPRDHSAPSLDAPRLRIEGVRKSYGPVAALAGITLDIAAGELFVLLGGSGSGKTTLLRAIAGFVPVDAGRILIDGADIAGLPPHRRPVNMMFQSYALFPHMSVADNVGYGLRRAGLPRAEIAARVAELLALVRLDGYGARWPDALSGGQQQRVALARALARAPRVLLLDEPLSALDRALRDETRAELVALQRRLGTTFVVVTHDQEEALGLATRLGVMRDGALAQVGTPREVYDRPADSFVARFLGAANVLRAHVRAAGPPAVLAVDGIADPVRAAGAAPCGPGGEIWLALRPERVRADAQATNRAAAVVAAHAFRGDAVLHTVHLPDGQAVRLVLPPEATVPIGAPLTIGWDADSGVMLTA